MGVCVFEWRYGSEEMRRILSREHFIEVMKRVEAALLEALVKAGIAPSRALEGLEEALDSVGAEEVYEEEKRIGHDIAALVFLLGRRAGEETSRWLHFGATSYDIVDTAWSLIIDEALDIIMGRLRAVIKRMTDMALKYRDTVMPGRTHGQHATPITLGFKLANYVYELSRSYERLCDARHRLVKAKLGGATGTLAAYGDKGLAVRSEFSKRLGLQPHPISTQVAPRDGLAELAYALAIMASQLDRFAVEVRELSRPEIGELWEERGRSVGSSAMPQKVNPVTAERISGLARVARSLAGVFLENIVLWHERDLTNSSAERYAVPHMLLVADQILIDTLRLLDKLGVDPERMKRNLGATMGTIVSEALLNELIRRGMRREEAYRIVQELSRLAIAESRPLHEVAAEDPRVSELVEADRLKRLLDPEGYLGSYALLIGEALEYSKRALATCRSSGV